MSLKLQKLGKNEILLYILDYLGYFINVNLNLWILESEYSCKESQKSKNNSLQQVDVKTSQKLLK